MNASSPTIYDTIRNQTLAQFDGVVEGNTDALFCVLSTQKLSDQARRALVSSAKALGYASRQCAFLRYNHELICHDEAVDPEDLQPRARQLFCVIEALDPLSVVITDYAAVRLASTGYNTALPLETKAHLLGHGCCCFDAFEALLTTEEGKQKAWACLKALPQIAQ